MKNFTMALEALSKLLPRTSLPLYTVKPGEHGYVEGVTYLQPMECNGWAVHFYLTDTQLVTWTCVKGANVEVGATFTSIQPLIIRALVILITDMDLRLAESNKWATVMVSAIAPMLNKQFILQKPLVVERTEKYDRHIHGFVATATHVISLETGMGVTADLVFANNDFLRFNLERPHSEPSYSATLDIITEISYLLIATEE